MTQRATLHSGVVHGSQFEREILIVFAFCRVPENRKRTDLSGAQAAISRSETRGTRGTRFESSSIHGDPRGSPPPQNPEDQEYATRRGLLGYRLIPDDSLVYKDSM